MALYHKYRPQQFSDLIGQDHIRTTLQNALKEDRVSHAYLFAGPRGLGKTTTARLLAKAVNCVEQNQKSKIKNQNDNSKLQNSDFNRNSKFEILNSSPEPCNKCQNCLSISKGQALDVLEIDGASNRGIDEIRELRELVKFPPSLMKKKVIIIDEVHMLTKDAFNALLKTLEEPPSHIIFALATTEPHKIQPTILSRVQRFDFKRPSLETLAVYLKKIAKLEKIKITDQAVNLLSELSDGSFRDGATLLEQISDSNVKEIGDEHIRAVLGLINQGTVIKFLQAIEEKNRQSAFAILDEFVSDGGDPSYFLNQLISLVRKKLRSSSKPEVAVWLENLVKAQEQQKYAPSPALPIELFIVRQTQAQISATKPVDAIAPESSEPKNIKTTLDLSEKPNNQILKTSNVGKIEPKFSQINEGVWHEIIEGIKQKNASLAAILKDSHLQGSKDGNISIAVKYKFHQDKISDPKNRALIEDALQEITGKQIRIDTILNPGFVEKRELVEAGDILEDAIDIFSS